MAADFTLEFPEGTDFLWEFTFQDIDGTAIDITGSTITFALFDVNSVTDPNPTAVLTYTTSNNITLTAPTSGTGTVDFDRADTVGLAAGYIAEIELLTAGDKTYSKWGKVKITPRRLD